MGNDKGKTNKEKKLNHRLDLHRRLNHCLPFKLAGELEELEMQ